MFLNLQLVNKQRLAFQLSFQFFPLSRWIRL